MRDFVLLCGISANTHIFEYTNLGIFTEVLYMFASICIILYGISIFSDDLTNASLAIIGKAVEPNTRMVVMFTRVSSHACWLDSGSSFCGDFLSPPSKSSSTHYGCQRGIDPKQWDDHSLGLIPKWSMSRLGQIIVIVVFLDLSSSGIGYLSIKKLH